MLRGKNEEQNGFGLHSSFRVQNPLFYHCKFVAQQKQDMIVDLRYKSQTKIAAPEGTRRYARRREAKLFLLMSWNNVLHAPLR